MQEHVLKMIENSLSLSLRRGRRTTSERKHGGQFTPSNLHFLDIRSGQFDFDHPATGQRVLKANNGFLISPGTTYSVCVKKGKGTIRYAHLDLTIYGSIDLTQYMIAPPLLPNQDAIAIGDCIETINATHTSQEDLLSIMTSRKIAYAQLLLLIIKNTTLSAEGKLLLENTDRLLPTLIYIQNNLYLPITREALAETIALSESRFSALFTQIMGISPLEFVRKAKLKEAYKLMTIDGLSVKETASRLSYCDSFHFSKIFKKEFDFAPSLAGAHSRSEI